MTVRFFYLSFFLILSVVTELVLLSFGLFFPFTAFFIFYTNVAFGWRAALACSVLGACGLDFTAGCAHPYSAAAFVLTLLLSQAWLYKVESESILLHFIPGGIVPFIVWGSMICVNLPPFSGIPHALALLVASSALGMLYLPLEIFLLDSLNEMLGLDLYTNAKLRLRNS